LQQTDSEVGSTERNGAHLYFAESAEHLTSLMRVYHGRRMILRPSNLEDVFLSLVSENGVEAGEGN
jgi:hypothetical protein